MKTKLYIKIIFLFFANMMYSNVVIMNGLTHVFSGRSGDVMQGQIIIYNPSSEAQFISLKLNDAFLSCEKDRLFTADSTHIRSSVGWFDGNLTDRELQPKEKFYYRFSIKIPKDGLLQGSYWNMLMIKVIKPEDTGIQKNGISIDSQMRYGIAILTNVNEHDGVALDFKKIDLNQVAANNQKNLSVEVVNEHLFFENVKLSLEVYDNNGKKVLDKKTKKSRVFPGFCNSYSIDVSKLKKGIYNCILVADAREEYIGTNVTITIE